MATILVTLTLVSRIPVLGDEAVWLGIVDLVAVCLVSVHGQLAAVKQQSMLTENVENFIVS